MIYFISDTHFYHKMMIEKYIDLPSVEDYNEWLIKRWNSIIGINDIVYHLGDFAITHRREEIEAVRYRLNGEIHLIWGNHDRKLVEKEWFRDMFAEVVSYKEFKYNKKKFVLFHYPIWDWNGKFHGSIHVHGHTHDKNKDFEADNKFCVVSNRINFSPVSIDTIFKKEVKNEDKRMV